MKLEALDHPKTLDLAARLNVELPWYRLPDEQFMDLDAFPFVPKSKRIARLRQDEWQELKSFVHEESGYVCAYCFRRLTPHDIEVCDHKIPLARGGSNDRDNLVTACSPCNTSKGMLTDSEFIAKRELQ